MSVHLNPYLNFRGEAKAAMQFYADALGGELSVSTFGEFNSADNQFDPADADKVMHAQLSTPEGFWLMGADVPQQVEAAANGTISLFGDDADTLRGYWTNLSDGGNVVMPLEKQIWGDEFGMLVDRFGVSWMVNISAAG